MAYVPISLEANQLKISGRWYWAIEESLLITSLFQLLFLTKFQALDFLAFFLTSLPEHMRLLSLNICVRHLGEMMVSRQSFLFKVVKIKVFWVKDNFVAHFFSCDIMCFFDVWISPAQWILMLIVLLICHARTSKLVQYFVRTNSLNIGFWCDVYFEGNEFIYVLYFQQRAFLLLLTNLVLNVVSNCHLQTESMSKNIKKVKPIPIEHFIYQLKKM